MTTVHSSVRVLRAIPILRPALRAALCLAPLAACARSAGIAERDVAGRIGRVERGLLPTVQVQGRSYAPATIDDRLRTLGVPAVSVAVIDRGRITWAKAYGLADVEAGRAASTTTLFQAASISKPVAAMAALRLVQEGRLSLDADVNEMLTSWKVHPNEFTGRRPVTLRGILSHSAGLTVHGFPGYAPGIPLPTVVQILDGTPPANTAPVRVDLEPGTRWRYSGGGLTVMQQLMIDVTGEKFPALMRRLVLGPVGMTASTYEQPLSASRVADAAKGYRATGRAVAGGYHTYPEMAAAGLWTTPTDLAQWIIEVQRSFGGASYGVLSRETTVEMLTRGVGSHGLGPGIDGSGDSLRFGHGGSNAGFRAVITGFATRGQGAVVMTNSDDGATLASEIIQAIAREYGWPGFTPRVVIATPMPAETIQEYEGRYTLEGAPIELLVAVEDGRLTAAQPGTPPVELVPTAADLFTPLGDVPPFRFERGSGGRIMAVIVGGTRLGRRD
jgi:CubicO group peptidase (beta-lactamase class C family)